MADKFEFSAIIETAKSITNDVVANFLSSKQYNHNKTAEWIDSIGSNVVAQLRELSPNFKYIVSVILTQKVGAALHVDMQSFWDTNTDGAFSTKFEGNDMVAICTVVGVAI